MHSDITVKPIAVECVYIQGFALPPPLPHPPNQLVVIQSQHYSMTVNSFNHPTVTHVRHMQEGLWLFTSPCWVQGWSRPSVPLERKLHLDSELLHSRVCSSRCEVEWDKRGLSSQSADAVLALGSTTDLGVKLNMFRSRCLGLTLFSPWKGTVYQKSPSGGTASRTYC